MIAGGKYLTLWDTSTWAEAHCINTSDTPAKAVFSPDGARIYTVSGGGRTNVYNSALVLQNEWVIVDSQVPNLELNDVDISPDGQLLAIGTRGGDPCTWLLNALTGAVALTLDVPRGIGYAVSFSPDGQHLAIAMSFSQPPNPLSKNTAYVSIMDAASGLEIRQLAESRGKPVLSVAYSPDGNQLVTSDINRVVQIWNPSNGAELQTLAAPPE